MYIVGKIKGIVNLSSADLNPLGIIVVIKVFKALYKRLDKLMHLININLNHLLLGNE